MPLFLTALAIVLSGSTGKPGLFIFNTEQEGGEILGGPAMPLPSFAHIVIVVEENRSYSDLMRPGAAPYLQALFSHGAVFTDSYAVAHPSQPNYLALFAGSTFGVTSDACQRALSPPDLGGELIANGMSFATYSENLPWPGFDGCRAGSIPGQPRTPLYARKHSPWVNFSDVPAAANQPFSAFPTDFNRLPTVSFVIPNQMDNMHSRSIAAGDAWLRVHLGAYVRWASTHNSLLIVTWDEDDRSSLDHIPTLFVGAHVRPGWYPETINHYDVLRTVEALCRLPFTHQAAGSSTIADVWQP